MTTAKAIERKLNTAIVLYARNASARGCAAARRKATKLAKELGWSFDEARQHFKIWINPYDEEGPIRPEREAILAQYGGSVDAALAPCEKEQALSRAVARWREADCTYPRWTWSLDGWHSEDTENPPAHIVDAIRSALPMPHTFSEAEDELRYWYHRGIELQILLDSDDFVLDETAALRMTIIETQIESELTVTTIDDLAVRVRVSARNNKAFRDNMTVILADVGRLAMRDP